MRLSAQRFSAPSSCSAAGSAGIPRSSTCCGAVSYTHLDVYKRQDTIHVPHCGQAVGDHQHGFALHQRLEGLLYLRLVLRVCKGAGLIQHLSLIHICLLAR